MRIRASRAAIFFILTALVPLVFFAACSNDAPALVSVDAAVVFDYADFETPPSVRLAVFAETESDVRRAAELKITSESTGFAWRAGDVQTIGLDGREWAGYANFVCPDDMTPPQGGYTLLYSDAGGNEIDARFSVSYPSALLCSMAGEAQELLGQTTERVAVYNADDSLVYFDARKDEWQELSAVWSEFPDAERLRLFISDEANSVVCLMPFERNSNRESAAADDSEEMNNGEEF